MKQGDSSLGSETGKDLDMHTLEKYVGRIVRLKQQALQDVARRGKPRKEPLENCFLVAAVSREMRKLICYGANLRIAVGALRRGAGLTSSVACAPIHGSLSRGDPPFRTPCCD